MCSALGAARALCERITPSNPVDLDTITESWWRVVWEGLGSGGEEGGIECGQGTWSGELRWGSGGEEGGFECGQGT
jgi:hypothetical protein